MTPQLVSAPYKFVHSVGSSGSQTLPVTRDASPPPGGPAEWTAEGARLSSETGLYSMREPASAALSAEDVCLRDGFTPDSQAASSVEGESSPRGRAGRGGAVRRRAKQTEGWFPTLTGVGHEPLDSKTRQCATGLCVARHSTAKP